MEMHQLRYFVAVAEELHFGRAARRENVSQPPLSLQIKKLEEELGLLLLARTKRRVALTEAGAAFLPEARSILATAANARHLAQAAHRGETGELRIGFVHSASLGYLPRLLAPFRAAFPQIALRLEEMTVTDQLAALQAGGIDIGVARPPVDQPGLDGFRVVAEAFWIAVPAGHRLADARQVTLRELAGEPFVFYPEHRSPAFYRQLMRMCATNGFSPEVAVEANTMYTAIGLVGTGVGLAIVPDSVSCVRISSVRFVALEGTTELAELHMVHRADRLTPCARQMVDFARRLAAEAPPA